MPYDLQHAQAQGYTYANLYHALIISRHQFGGIPLTGEDSVAQVISEALKPNEVAQLIKALSDNGHNPVESNSL